MTGHWSGPAWGEPSGAAGEIPPLRPVATARDAAYRAEGGRFGAFLVLGASVGGVSHRLAKRRCEDTWGWAAAAPGRLGLVVADGVGSAGRGGEGAELAVGAACRSLAGEPGEWGREECLRCIVAAQLELERAGGEEAAQLATTLVVALLEAGAMKAKVTLGRVGDSSAFSLSATGGWAELFEPPAGEAGEEEAGLLPGTTAVLPIGAPLKRTGSGPGEPGMGASPAGEAWASLVADGPPEGSAKVVAGGLVQLASAELTAGSAIVLVTDGVAEPLRDGPATVAPQLAQVLSRGAQGELSPLELAHAADFSRRGAHDDRTVLAAWLLGSDDPGGA